MDVLLADEVYDAKRSWMEASIENTINPADFSPDTKDWGWIADDETEADREDMEAIGLASTVSQSSDLAEGTQHTIDDQDKKNTIQSKETSIAELISRVNTGTSITNTTSSPSLRPAMDILNRIRHDPSMDEDDFIIGYEDRHAGTKELAAKLWSSNVSSEYFIPQSRIRYFKQKSNGQLVWHRQAKLDLMFGSGIGVL